MPTGITCAAERPPQDAQGRAGAEAPSYNGDGVHLLACNNDSRFATGFTFA
jgi:hypothetical protein